MAYKALIMDYIKNIQKLDKWFIDDVFPLWTAKAIDLKNGGFIESIELSGEPLALSRRALVQARQIYSYTEGGKLNYINKDLANNIVYNNIKFTENYSLQSGACLHAVDASGKPSAHQSELYTQAFMLFGFARAYECLGDEKIKIRALKLLNYLKNKRQNRFGGFIECKNGQPLFESNPHMHLFEAALEWMRMDSNTEWKNLAHEIYTLFKEKFVNNEMGVVAEHFTEDWQILCENGKFVFEPGHQYEWSWLLQQFQKMTSVNTKEDSLRIFELAEKYGVDREVNLAYDEVLSDYTIKKSSSRFWPQCERIKAAVELGLSASSSNRSYFTGIADGAMSALQNYFETSVPGLWHDTKADGKFILQAAKASSLYHIINAVSEYKSKRPLLD